MEEVLDKHKVDEEEGNTSCGSGVKTGGRESSHGSEILAFNEAELCSWLQQLKEDEETRRKNVARPCDCYGRRWSRFHKLEKLKNHICCR